MQLELPNDHHSAPLKFSLKLPHHGIHQPSMAKKLFG
jgi:hypothetical protein